MLTKSVSLAPYLLGRVGWQSLRELLNDLMHPVAHRRLGARGTGPKEVRHAKWFAGFTWEKLEAGKVDAPHVKQAMDAIIATQKSSNGKKSAILPDEYKGDTQWYYGFSSFFNQPPPN